MIVFLKVSFSSLAQTLLTSVETSQLQTFSHNFFNSSNFSWNTFKLYVSPWTVFECWKLIYFLTSYIGFTEGGLVTGYLIFKVNTDPIWSELTLWLKILFEYFRYLVILTIAVKDANNRFITRAWTPFSKQCILIRLISNLCVALWVMTAE